jgi:hypothetical protein
MSDQQRASFSHYMTFRLGDELFAVNVSHVREVLDLMPITRVPTAPSYMRGVVNVRGRAVPVVNLRAKFGLPDAVDTVQTRIMVLEIDAGGEACILGDRPTASTKFSSWRRRRSSRRPSWPRVGRAISSWAWPDERTTSSSSWT